MYRRQILSLAGGIVIAGCSSSGQVSDPESGEKDRSTPTPREKARQAAKQGLDSGGTWSIGTREIDFRSMVGGGFSVDTRYNLDHRTLGGSFTAEKAEKRAGWTAWTILKRLSSTHINNLVEAGIFAYVPTKDGGDTVSTKVVMTIETADRIDWESNTWRVVRDRADQYKFNEYLY